MPAYANVPVRAAVGDSDFRVSSLAAHKHGGGLRSESRHLYNVIKGYLHVLKNQQYDSFTGAPFEVIITPSATNTKTLLIALCEQKKGNMKIIQSWEYHL